MNEQQLKALDDMLKVRLTLHEIIIIETSLSRSISILEDYIKENPLKGISKDHLQEYKKTRKKVEIIWDEMRKREMAPNEYLERFQEI